MTLARGQRRAHVADQAVIGHWHRRDRIVDACGAGGLLDQMVVGGRIEKGDIVGQRAGEQMVVLKHGADSRAPGPDVCRCQRLTVDQQLAPGRGQQAEHDPHQRRLACARFADDRSETACGNFEIQIAQDRRIARGVCEAEVLGTDRRCRQRSGTRRGGNDVFAGMGDDIGEAFEMHRQQSVVLGMIDEGCRTGDETRPIGKEGKHHADRHLVGNDSGGRQINGEQQLETEQKRLDQPRDDLVALLAIVGRNDGGVAIAPTIFTHRFMDVQFDRSDRADAFHKEGFLIGARNDLFLGPPPQCGING